LLSQGRPLQVKESGGQDGLETTSALPRAWESLLLELWLRILQASLSLVLTSVDSTEIQQLSYALDGTQLGRFIHSQETTTTGAMTTKLLGHSTLKTSFKCERQ
jgi:hypothetical protein